LTDPKELICWWCDQAEVDLRPGGLYSFAGSNVFAARPPAVPGGAREGSPPGGQSGGNFEITELVPESRLEFRWWLDDLETRAAYELVNHLEQTELTVIQTAEKAPAWDPGSEMPSWWWVALPALSSYLEKGKADLRLDYPLLRLARDIAFEVGVSTFPWIIWHKLTDPKELERWWAKKAEVDLRPGGAFHLGLKGLGPTKTLELDEGKRLLLDWAWKDGTAGRVEWRVEETDGDTLLSVRDFGPWDPSVPRDGYSIYWAATLLGLKQMSERGITPGEYQDAP
jgi:uncharacterized protein YndB with AHSA1/START domain